ncbi:putative G-type lectin S-receptor-like serine/threonine-protein kinase [Cocos nucifera]|uniref:Putative G-type lectin S-receptor-like serine/threonine-protein kinase n=1 Tax=Cocos nucifera TaxID=13894 RepID=A0A8K0IRS2_COCNU|nr:putative G-type lectin S-receptor-like serine/threonine-protein kinase [Cocos nucifera]
MVVAGEVLNKNVVERIEIALARRVPETNLSPTRAVQMESRLGEGGFGPVYKGKLPGGQEIAVKRLSKKSGQGLKEFKNEVELISKLQHRNLVRLLGCCMHGKEKLLIYEFMPNKSLDAFLFGRDREDPACFELFSQSKVLLQMIVFFIENNILLYEQFNPRISDFGMARIFGRDQSLERTDRVVGTIGYMSPEYAMEGQISEKSDVFSFGVLLLEVVSGKRNNHFVDDEKGLNLLGYWYGNYLAKLGSRKLKFLELGMGNLVKFLAPNACSDLS